jgi:16S rRNA (adenine1518-N6/adenine1519-N6)-dimethyltransferase
VPSSSAVGLIDKERCYLAEKFAQKLFGLRRESGFVECLTHQLHPAIAGSAIDMKWRMPLPQTWMTALFDVALRSAESKDQKVAQPLFGAVQIIWRIHAAQNIVMRYLAVKGTHQPRETVFPDHREEIRLVHGLNFIAKMGNSSRPWFAYFRSVRFLSVPATSAKLGASMARQKLGQHFLSSPAWQARILEKLPLTSGEIWIEIGAGRGEMTRQLAAHNGRGGMGVPSRIIAIETDPTLAGGLRAQIAAHPSEWDGVEIAEGDVLALDLAGLAGLPTGAKFRVYGNLPYYITSPILHHLFQWADHISSIHIVIQLEVAERIVARPGVRDYGYLSVACQFYTRPEIALKIPPGAFRPPPKVNSALVAMSLPGAGTSLGVPDHAAFLKFVQTCFAHKRKTLRNNLLALAPDVWIAKTLVELKLPSDVRAEQLSVAEFARLSAKFHNM